MLLTIGPTLKLGVFVGVGQSMNDFLRKKKMIKNTEKNCDLLAKEIVDSWDMDSLVNYAIDRMSNFFQQDKKDFEAEWNEMEMPLDKTA